MNTLQKFGLNKADLGAALIEAAQGKERENLLSNMTEEVQRIMRAIDATKQRIESEEVRLKVYQRRLEAITKGKFTVDTNKPVNGVQVTIVYDDAALNASWIT